jgi:TolB-like protein
VQPQRIHYWQSAKEKIMKNIFTAIILGIALAGVSFAQADKSTKPRIAVLEFADASGAMTAEAKRQLQASIAFELVKHGDFEVPDVRNTRAATQGGGTAASIGKKLGVEYVLTGSVIEYSTTTGRMTVRTQLIQVATGKVKLSGDTSEQSARPMTGNAGHAEMSAKVVKPLIQKLAASIKAADL